MTGKLKKVHFVFDAKCNMTCPFCYVPFQGKESDLSQWIKILERIEAEEPARITFSGGDPFRYRDFPQLLTYVRGNNTIVQVDTNSLGLRLRHLPILHEKVDMVGLPLDGTEGINRLVRNHPTHYRSVVKWLEVLTSEKIDVKVNTVATRINVHDLVHLAEVLKDFPISTWSIYQFLPISEGEKNRDWLELDDAVFLAAAETVQQISGIQDIQIFPAEKRMSNWTSGHFVVDHLGIVYVTDRFNPTRNQSIGSIFDADIFNRWQEVELASYNGRFPISSIEEENK